MYPIFRHTHRRINTKVSVCIPVTDDGFRIPKGKRQTAPNKACQLRMTRIYVVDPELNEHHSAINGANIRHQWPYARPCAISANDQVKSFASTFPEHQLERFIVLLPGCAQFMIPADNTRRQRIQQHLPKLTSIYLWAIFSRNVSVDEQKLSVFVINSRLLIFITGDALEFGSQSGALDSKLARIHMHVERSSLRPNRRKLFPFEDRCINTIDVKNTSESQTARSCSDNGDTWFIHA